jgi:predicted chitinase
MALIGNKEPGDGVKYKGGGFIQLTGRSNYEHFSRGMNDPRIEAEGTSYVAVNYPWESATYFWKFIGRLNEKVDKGASVDDVTLIVNGPRKLGLDDRKKAYNKCREIFY